MKQENLVKMVWLSFYISVFISGVIIGGAAL